MLFGERPEQHGRLRPDGPLVDGAQLLEILSELHKWEAVVGVLAGVLVHPGRRDVQETRGVVDGEEFIAERDCGICVRMAFGGIERVHRTHVSPDLVEGVLISCR